jgi:hypothetical protein
VGIHPDQALHPERLQHDKDGKLGARREKVGAALPADRWWWD